MHWVTTSIHPFPHPNKGRPRPLLPQFAPTVRHNPSQKPPAYIPRASPICLLVAVHDTTLWPPSTSSTINLSTFPPLPQSDDLHHGKTIFSFFQKPPSLSKFNNHKHQQNQQSSSITLPIQPIPAYSELVHIVENWKKTGSPLKGNFILKIGLHKGLVTGE